MKFEKLELAGACLISPQPVIDDRGFFARAFCSKEFALNGLERNFVQCNISYNEKCNTVRGLHSQDYPFQEVKLVRCTRGQIFDVIVDVQKTSPTYKKWYGTVLSETNRKMLYVPKGFAHGYLTMEDKSEVFYQVTEFYSPGHESGYHWNDPSFGIEWPTTASVHISEKDSKWEFI
jgi:dTDP-4-dehydrorhamnose 3,5-epimerase